MPSGVTAVVLAGGKSRRFGSDKASALLAGRPLLQWVIEAVATVAGEVVVVAAAGQVVPSVTSTVPLTVVRDRHEAVGPLAGMVAGFGAAANDVCLVLSCDAPLLVPGLLEHLVERLGEAGAAVVPEVGGKLQPLVAAYRASLCALEFQKQLENGQRTVVRAVEALPSMIVVGEAEVMKRDLELRSFMGVNTVEELARVERLV